MVVYRIFSPVKYPWRFALLGAAVSAIILEIGKFFIDLYIGFAGVSVIYGTAGSLAILMFWIFFSALILLYGAEVTKVTAIEYMGKKRKKWFWFF
jgi:membrane protein